MRYIIFLIWLIINYWHHSAEMQEVPCGRTLLRVRVPQWHGQLEWSRRILRRILRNVEDPGAECSMPPWPGHAVDGALVTIEWDPQWSVVAVEGIYLSMVILVIWQWDDDRNGIVATRNTEDRFDSNTCSNVSLDQIFFVYFNYSLRTASVCETMLRPQTDTFTLKFDQVYRSIWNYKKKIYNIQGVIEFM